MNNDEYYQNKPAETQEIPSEQGIKTLEEYWEAIDEKKLIANFKQLNQFDSNSKEVICAEIKKRGLEAKAAYKIINVYKVDLEELGNIPFRSILSFVWKWTWACIIVAIPFFLVYIIALSAR